jgi:hypothetical protein
MQLIQIISIGGSVLLLISVIELIRRSLLKERYAILWLFSVVIVLIFSIWQKLLDKVAGGLGVAYPPSLLFLVAFIFLLLITLHFSVVLSSLSKRNKTLSQKIAILDARMEEINNKNKINQG